MFSGVSKFKLIEYIKTNMMQNIKHDLNMAANFPIIVQSKQ